MKNVKKTFIVVVTILTMIFGQSVSIFAEEIDSYDDVEEFGEVIAVTMDGELSQDEYNAELTDSGVADMNPERVLENFLLNQLDNDGELEDEQLVRPISEVYDDLQDYKENEVYNYLNVASLKELVNDFWGRLGTDLFGSQENYNTLIKAADEIKSIIDKRVNEIDNATTFKEFAHNMAYDMAQTFNKVDVQSIYPVVIAISKVYSYEKKFIIDEDREVSLYSLIGGYIDSEDSEDKERYINLIREDSDALNMLKNFFNEIAKLLKIENEQPQGGDDNALKPLSILAYSANSYLIGSNKAFSVTFNSPLQNLKGVYVDGTLLKSTDYKAVEGSTRITLNPEYLNGLKIGNHIMEVSFNEGAGYSEGSLEFPFSVTGSKLVKSPDTGDSQNIAYYMAGALVSSLGFLVLLISKKKMESK